jgi:preprotein translocase subunit SecA
MRVLLDFIQSKLKSTKTIAIQQLLTILDQLAREVLELEKTHLIASAGIFLDKTHEAFQQQLAQKLDEVDIYFEGLQMQSGEPGTNPKAIFNQIQSTFNIRLNYSQEQIKNIFDYLDQMHQEVKEQVQANAMKALLLRISKVYGSKLQESLNLPTDEGLLGNWDAIRESVFTWLIGFVDSKITALCGEQGQARQNILAILNGRDPIEWEDNLMLEILSRMDEVNRLVLDPRSHKKLMKRGNLLNYLYWVGHKLENQEPESLTAQTLDHLIKVQKLLQMAFGQMQLRTLLQSQVTYEQLDPILKLKIDAHLGAEKYRQLLLQPQTINQQPGFEKVTDVLGEDLQNYIYRNILLNAISSLWIEHLTHMEGLRVSIGMEAYAQRDPLVQYKSQASDAFKNLLDNIRMTVISQMFRARPNRAKTATKSSGQESHDSPNPSSSSHGKNKFKKHRHR